MMMMMMTMMIKYKQNKLYKGVYCGFVVLIILINLC